MKKKSNLFYKCNKCGTVIDWYRSGYNAHCKHCGEGTLLPMKELYVVNTEREKETLAEAFKLLNCEECEIAVLNISNDGVMLDDDIVFASPDSGTWDIKALRRKYKGCYEEHLKSLLEFFSIDFSRYDRVIVCHAGGIHGTLCEYVLSYKFEKEGLELYWMDLTAALEILRRSGGYCEDFEPESPLFGIFGFVFAASNPTVHVSKVSVEYGAGEWRRLFQSQTGLCIFDGNQVINVSPTFYDASLIEAASTIDDNDSKLIAIAVHARTNNVTLEFLRGRVKKLVREGKIRFAKK